MAGKNVHLKSGGPAYQVGENEMEMLERLRKHFGDAPRASVLRMAIKNLYDSVADEMDAKPSTAKHKK